MGIKVKKKKTMSSLHIYSSIVVGADSVKMSRDITNQYQLKNTFTRPHP